MAYPDKLFCQEFRQMMVDRNSLIGNDPRFHLVELPMPVLRGMVSAEAGNSLAKVVGVKEKYFSSLNDCIVTVLKRSTYKKRQIDSNGSFLKDRDDNLVYTQVPVTHGSVAILSNKCIRLRNRVVENGVTKRYVPSTGFKYIDYMDLPEGRGRRYIYIIPKEYVYRLNTCALVLSQSSLRNYYKGYRLALQNGGYVYLYVVPSSKLRQASYRVLGIKLSPDFSVEIKSILNLWQSLGVIFDLNTTVVGVSNLGISALEGTLYMEDFRLTDKSLSDVSDEEEVVYG